MWCGKNMKIRNMRKGRVLKRALVLASVPQKSNYSEISI
jgi:hypothetical protein